MRVDRRAVVGIVLSLVLLVGMFLLVPFSEVLEQLRRADPVYFGIAVVLATLGIPIRAIRWKVLLQPVSPGIGFHARHAATAIGFAANNVLPARAGEFARAFVLGRLSNVPITAALGTLVVERIFDSLVIVALLFAAMAAPQFPMGVVGGVDPRHAAGVIALIMVGVTLVLFAMVVAPDRTSRYLEAIVRRVVPHRFQRLVIDLLHAFLRGVAVLRSPRLFVVAALWAIAQWVFLAFSFHYALLAFGITVPGLVGAFFLQSLVAMAVAAPSSPGYVGTYHAGAVLGLSLWGVPADQAVSFAIAFHIGGFVPVTLLGAFYLWRLNLSWGQIEASKEVVEEGVEQEFGHSGAIRDE
jgi:glycosyltransferase 2 family protein